PSGTEATHPTAMSKSLKKKSHWTSKVHESVIGRNPEGQLGFELKGGAENGQFPYLGEVKPGKVAYESGSKLVSEELLLEVNETPVAGLTIRDVLAVIKHCKDPLRLKCVKQDYLALNPENAFHDSYMNKFLKWLAALFVTDLQSDAKSSAIQTDCSCDDDSALGLEEVFP
ncbi:hypothetical protein STEG23_011482, partial [Scotinomys teguina]